MSTSITPFTFPATGQEVRTILVNGEPWWVAADVCTVLEIANVTRALASLDEDEKGLHSVKTPGGDQALNIVTEPGLYSLILRSRKPQAKAFKRWITHEVIPSIRKTGRYEVSAAEPKPREVTAAAGPVPYKEQAEILAILRPMLPEAYATATGKVILARSMGERPELDSSETPLYASTFLAEKGLSKKAVSKFESPFGLRVSNRYLKVHGRRPEKIPGPAGSRIDKVVAYTEDDRPLLEEVFADIADMVEAFEVDLAGGQLAMVGGAA